MFYLTSQAGRTLQYVIKVNNLMKSETEQTFQLLWKYR